MEEIPFNSGDNEDDTSNNFELFDDDDESEEETEETTERRSLFSELSKDKTEDDPDEDEAGAKRRVFASLFEDDNEPDAEFSEFVGVADSEQEQVSQEFQEVVEGRLDDVESSIGAAPKGEVEELTADASFLSNVGERMAQGVPPQEAIEDALNASTEELEDTPSQEIEEPTAFELPEEEEEIVPPPTQTAKRSSGRSARRTSTSSSPPPPIIPPTLTPVSQTPGRGGSGSGSTRGGAGGPPMPPSPNAPAAANQSPNTLNPNLTPDSPDVSRMNQLYYRDRRRGDLLLGGAIGYLFGRRRGRKKAEARLEPEISERDETIKELSGDLERSEAAVRKAASESIKTEVKAEKSPEPALPPRPEKIPAESLSEELKEIIQQEEEFEKTLVQEKEKEDKAEKDKEPLFEDGATELAYDVKAEQAKAKIAAEEELREIKNEQFGKKRSTGTERFTEKKKNVNLMSTAEMLEVADSIKLDSIPLRELFESGRINELNLRRVITEFVHGRNYEKVLRGSLETVELKGEMKAEKERSEQRFEKLPSNNMQSGKSSPIVTGSQIDAVHPLGNNEPAQNHVSETIERDASLKVTSATAIMIGVLSGVAIVILAILYSNSL